MQMVHYKLTIIIIIKYIINSSLAFALPFYVRYINFRRQYFVHFRKGLKLWLEIRIQNFVRRLHAF